MVVDGSAAAGAWLAASLPVDTGFVVFGDEQRVTLGPVALARSWSQVLRTAARISANRSASSARVTSQAAWTSASSLGHFDPGEHDADAVTLMLTIWRLAVSIVSAGLMLMVSARTG